MGKFFEDFQVGERIETGGRTLTSADLVLFAGITGNANPLHMDEEYAKSLGHKGRLVHGLLTLSLLGGLFDRTGVMEGTILAHLGISEVKFLQPVYVGDTLHAVSKITEKKRLADGRRGIITMETVGINQHGLEVIRTTDTALFRCRKERQSES